MTYATEAVDEAVVGAGRGVSGGSGPGGRGADLATRNRRAHSELVKDRICGFGTPSQIGIVRHGERGT